MAEQISVQPVAKENLKSLVVDYIIKKIHGTHGEFIIRISGLKEGLRRQGIECKKEEILEIVEEIIVSDCISIRATGLKLGLYDLPGADDKRIYPSCVYILSKKSEMQEVSSILSTTTQSKLKHIAVSRGIDLSEHIKDELERSI